MSTINSGITQDLNTIANGTNSTASSVIENPDGVLGKDSFMKLLLVELQYQDPTEPMDSEKILTQTSQLASLESATNTNKTMEKLASRLDSNGDLQALSAIGKMASLGSNAITLQEKGNAQFEIYFENEIKSGELIITDVNGEKVRTISLDEQVGESGVLAFEWDGTDNNGEKLDAGYYSVTSEYLDANDEQQATQFGIYPVESVRYQDGEAFIKLGSSYVPMNYILEFF
ncbi:flagellar hook capping FlgD N-terminal domain-containing protein [Sulfurospirillum arcachonense]|uniref:flagellar hook capping FlgD N-terminal domain-containing protein n=1 Tax=Sulfurospirillum arcachonense TaxID=57666 RepID=UPI0004687347|nr:flagellar hook capping FlgD N-terminal domain-containing protein [Sulfurospirillum arcachonense]